MFHKTLVIPSFPGYLLSDILFQKVCQKAILSEKFKVPKKTSIMMDMSKVLRYTTFKHLKNIDIKNDDARNSNADNIKSKHRN